MAFIAPEFGRVESPIRKVEQEHDEAVAALRELRALTNNYTAPENAPASHKAWYALLKEFDADMHLHIHLERNILFPGLWHWKRNCSTARDTPPSGLVKRQRPSPECCILVFKTSNCGIPVQRTQRIDIGRSAPKPQTIRQQPALPASETPAGQNAGGGRHRTRFPVAVAHLRVVLCHRRPDGSLDDGGRRCFVTLIEIVQEFRSEKALEALRQFTRPRAVVIRNGERLDVPVEDIVVDDIMVFEEGERLPADGRLLQQNDFSVDEAILTGESLPVNKTLTAKGRFIRAQP
ncbi:MAG: hemerythrin domain-containing protein [Lewinellaceae bacterium]|nr:hemerythrin domain-containing protein [Lewinellaceae bacterium]